MAKAKTDVSSIVFTRYRLIEGYIYNQNALDRRNIFFGFKLRSKRHEKVNEFYDYKNENWHLIKVHRSGPRRPAEYILFKVSKNNKVLEAHCYEQSFSKFRRPTISSAADKFIRNINRSLPSKDFMNGSNKVENVNGGELNLSIKNELKQSEVDLEKDYSFGSVIEVNELPYNGNLEGAWKKAYFVAYVLDGVLVSDDALLYSDLPTKTPQKFKTYFVPNKNHRHVVKDKTFKVRLFGREIIKNSNRYYNVKSGEYYNDSGDIFYGDYEIHETDITSIKEYLSSLDKTVKK